MSTSPAEGAVIGILFALVITLLLVFAYRYVRSLGYVSLTVGAADLTKYDDPEADQNHELRFVESRSVGNPLQQTGQSSRSNPDLEDSFVEKTEQVVIEGIIKAGYLSKRSTGLSEKWQKRWFFIKDRKLYYCHKPSDLIGKQFIEAVCVANLLLSTVKETNSLDFQVISPGERKTGAGGGAYALHCDDADEAADWVSVMRQQIQGSITAAAASTVMQKSPNDNTFVVLEPAVLQELRNANPVCAECGTANPDWASLNLCIMICIECSGIHRSLGTHVSKVRSLTLDRWSDNCTKLLLDIGNSRANAIWEATLDSSTKPTPAAGRDIRESFINNKYVKKQYISAPAINSNAALLNASFAGNLLDTYRSLTLGANIDATSGPDKALRTALQHAAAIKNAELVELLCLWNAAVDAIDAGGKTALRIANERNADRVAQTLGLYGGK